MGHGTMKTTVRENLPHQDVDSGCAGLIDYNSRWAERSCVLDVWMHQVLSSPLRVLSFVGIMEACAGLQGTAPPTPHPRLVLIHLGH